MPHSLRRLRISTVAIAAPCVEPGYAAIPTPFLAVLVFWLAILFAGFGLLSSNNRTVIATLFVCALSVAGAVFLIEDIAHPLEGLMQISNAPARRMGAAIVNLELGLDLSPSRLRC
jgi:hypothetical protein